MLNNQINADPVLMHVEPVLAVRDVEASVIYWHELLGFTYKWTWGEPPNHGGVSRDGVFIQFSLLENNWDPFTRGLDSRRFLE